MELLNTTTLPPQVQVDIPPAYLRLFDTEVNDIPVRYKVYFGGRVSAKSWSMARALVADAYTSQHLILCTREFQNSIADSVHRVIQRQIELLGLRQWFEVTQTSIKCRLTGSEFIFKGLRRNIQEVRSLEGVTRCWIEEAQWTTQDSWLILDPTIREDGSQVWVSYNPVDEEDAIHQLFVVNPPPDNAIVVKTSWRDNPWFTTEQNRMRLRMMRTNPDTYDWVWEGHTRRISEAAVFRGRYEVREFEPPPRIDRYFQGMDFGFANDPTVCLRCYVVDNTLYVVDEVCGSQIEIDELPAFLEGGTSPRTGVDFTGISGIKDWPIKADSARPETISYLSHAGFRISAAEKWKGCVEDGISHLKGFDKIVIHPRCSNTIQEMRLYSYKTDPRTEDILPVVVDAYNHSIDACRYALDGYIQHRGGLGVWERLGRVS